MLTLLFLVHELTDFISSFNYFNAASEIIFIFWTNVNERMKKKNGANEEKKNIAVRIIKSWCCAIRSFEYEGVITRSKLSQAKVLSADKS